MIKNKNLPVMYMLVGLPGSGKSTYAKIIAKKSNSVIYSSDAIREELYGSEEIQGDSQTVFQMLHSCIKDELRNNVNVIYDACNISYKRRMGFLQELKKIPCYKVCIFIATPYCECIKNNENRERCVPVSVIDRMYKHFDVPCEYEGWDDINVYYAKSGYRSYYGTPESFVKNHMTYNQDNSYHEKSLGEHCLSAGNYFSTTESLLHTAGMLHDCGKPFCKTFTNSKGDEAEEAHYYSHERVGSYDSLFYDTGLKAKDRRKIATIIRWHMMPYVWERENNEKLKTKYSTLWGKKLFNLIMLLHKADKFSH